MSLIQVLIDETAFIAFSVLFGGNSSSVIPDMLMSTSGTDMVVRTSFHVLTEVLEGADRIGAVVHDFQEGCGSPDMRSWNSCNIGWNLFKCLPPCEMLFSMRCLRQLITIFSFFPCWPLNSLSRPDRLLSS